MFGKLLTIISFFSLAFLKPDLAFSADPVSVPGLAPSGHGIPVVTLYVQQFGELEKQLLVDLQAAHRDQVETVISDIFELRESNGKTLSRADWISQNIALKNNPSIDFSQFVVYESGSAAVASFRLKSGNSQEPDHFYVDVWVPADNGWQLRARFDSPLSAKK